MGVHASNNENSDSENNDLPLRASEMKDLKHPATLLYQNESDVDVTIQSNEESDEEEYYTSATCKTLRIEIAVKTLMNLSSSLMKVKYSRKIFLHESFRQNFRKSSLKLLATLKYMQKVQAVSTRESSSVSKIVKRIIFQVNLGKTNYDSK